MWLLIIILIILSSLYAYNTYQMNMKFNTEYQILQLKPSQLTDAIIEERNPIIVETSDMVNDVLMSDVLRNKQKRVGKVREQTLLKNSAQLKALSYNKNDKAMVEIITPKHAQLDREDPEYQSMTIVLRKGHVLLLPFMWHFSSDRDLTTVDIHDWFSRILSHVM
jgi:hypothetical protein